MLLAQRTGANGLFRLKGLRCNRGLLQPIDSFQQPYRLTPVRMVEGHGCHRVAHAHRKLLVGKRFTATSPNSRFTEGAQAVNNQPLTRIEVHGKNLFYFFGDEAAPHVVHIHFGMSGAFKTMTLPGPEATDTTRLTLVNQDLGIVASLSAMTVNLGDLAYYQQKAAKLGPDPLRGDADGELLWQKMRVSKKPIGALLMDQTAVAGIGNIYRAEILFKAGVHPEQPSRSVDRAGFEALWRHSVLLLQRGFKTGSILTVDEDEAKRLGQPWTRRHVYNHKTCGRCGSSIRTWDMLTRTVYACEVCQPLRLEAGTELDPARAKAHAASGPTKQFKSHCAPEPAVQAVPAQMTVAELKAALTAQGLMVKGTKKVLVARLEEAQGEGGEEAGQPSGPIGGVQPGLHVDQDKVIEGPEPLMGLKHLDALEKGKLEAGSSAAPADKDLAAQQEVPPAKMTVPQLKDQLRTFNMFTSGRKADLVHRLETALAAAAATGHASHADRVTGNAEHHIDAGTANGATAAASAATAATSGAASAENDATAARGSTQDLAVASADGQAASSDALVAPPVAGVQPGTEQLGDVATFQVAATEKAAAGEGRNVEHVAEADDLTHAAVNTTRTNRSRKSKHNAADPEAPKSQPKRRRRAKAGVV